MMSRSRGFTLIELLVVIAIIAILAAILFPVFARARSKANAASCLSNMKQMSLAMTMYASDYDNFVLPYAWDSSSTDSNGLVRTWATLLVPYVKNSQIFVCPSDTNKRAQNINALGGSGNTLDPATPPIVSYCMNGLSGSNFANCSGSNVGFYVSYLTNLSSLDDCSRTIIFYDFNDNNTSGSVAAAAYRTYDQFDFAPPGSPTGYPSTTSSTVGQRHAGGYNAAYCDGHARWLKWSFEQEPDYKDWVVTWYPNAACP
jgi:prepilin-type N-terminal cleavage/methylation domain-containing protein/prepilin-type processing-associated H-X9-DG protein